MWDSIAEHELIYLFRCLGPFEGASQPGGRPSYAFGFGIRQFRDAGNMTLGFDEKGSTIGVRLSRGDDAMARVHQFVFVLAATGNWYCAALLLTHKTNSFAHDLLLGRLTEFAFVTFLSNASRRHFE